MDADSKELPAFPRALFIYKWIAKRDGWIAAEAREELSHPDHVRRVSNANRPDSDDEERPRNQDGDLPSPVISDEGDHKETHQRPEVNKGSQNSDEIILFADQVVLRKGKHHRIFMPVDKAIPLFLGQWADELFAFLFVFEIKACVFVSKEEPLSKKDHASEEPQQAEEEKGQELIPSFAVDFLN